MKVLGPSGWYIKYRSEQILRTWTQKKHRGLFVTLPDATGVRRGNTSVDKLWEEAADADSAKAIPEVHQEFWKDIEGV
jgi:hypothetical protein